MSPSGKRDAILQATLALVSERGFHGTPMALVAERAGVAAGTIYRYFESKEDLLGQLYQALKADFRAALSEGIRKDMPFEALFERAWTNAFRFYVKRPQAFSFMEQYADSPFLTDATRSATARGFAPFAQAFRRAMDERRVVELPLQLHFGLFAGAASALAKQHLSGQLRMTPALQKAAAQAAWRAIRR